MDTCNVSKAVKVLNEAKARWIANGSTYLLLAFLFTLLYLYDQKQNELTYADVDKLRADFWTRGTRSSGDSGTMQGTDLDHD